MSEITIKLSENIINQIEEASNIRKIDKDRMIKAIILEWALKDMMNK